MDQRRHMLEDMMSHYRSSLDFFIEEHKENGYTKLSDNRYYDEVNTIIKAINVVRRALNEESIKLSEEVKYRL